MSTSINGPSNASTKAPCGCCEGIEAVTPESVANPPGQPALRYRVGTHATFLETMKARLSASDFPELSALTARDGADASIAFLDAWACIGDVLTFYQERIANEGYLRTATERYSLTELARQVGYRPRPGVAASVFLAYEMEANSRAVITEGTRSQSLPGPEQLPQSFESAEAIEARVEWNDLTPRRTRPQRLDSHNAFYVGTIRFEGISLNLKAGDPLLLTWGDGDGEQILRFVAASEVDSVAGATIVTLATELTHQNQFSQRLLNGTIVGATLPTNLSGETAFHAMQDVAGRFWEEAFEYPLPEEGSREALFIKSFLEILDEARSKRFREAIYFILFLLFFAELAQATRRDLLYAAYGSIAAWLEDFAAEMMRLRAAVPPTGQADITDAVQLIRDRMKVKTTNLLLETEAEKNDAKDTTQRTPEELRRLTQLCARLSQPPSVSPATAFGLRPEFSSEPSRKAEDAARLLGSFFAAGTERIVSGVSRLPTPVAPPSRQENADGLREALPVTVYALRVTSRLFGHNALQRITFDRTGNQTAAEWLLLGTELPPPESDGLYLEREFPDVFPGDWAVVRLASSPPDASDDGLRYARVGAVEQGVSRANYNLSGKTTVLRLVAPDNPGLAWPWRLSRSVLNSDPPTNLRNVAETAGDLLTPLRRTTVFTKSEALTLAEEPIRAPVNGKSIMLRELYDGLTPGRRIIIVGERADVLGVEGLPAAEAAMIVSVEQAPDPHRPGDTPHTILTLYAPLAYAYRRDNARIYGNVARATHGETRRETLGSGNAAATFQRYSLRQTPLTFVSSPNPSGAESSLRLYVDDVRWHETESLSGAAPDAHQFVTSDDEDGKATLFFGDGVQGARLPTGFENVRAVYRTGIGKPGNVNARQISQLTTRPLGVKSVVNPLSATGGADAERAERIRRHIPLSLASLERLISVSDYAAFSRVFAGVGKATAARLTNGRSAVLQVTIAGEDDIPLAEDGDLFVNLKAALRRYGDPIVALSLRRRERIAPRIKANIKILPDYLWEKVCPAVRMALYEAFSFESRELGQSLFVSEALAVMQDVPGVDYVDIDTFLGLSESDAKDAKKLNEFLKDSADASRPRKEAILAQGDRVEEKQFRPAQVVYLDPELPESLIINPVV